MHKKGVHIGWGATCALHRNDNDVRNVQCKKQQPFGEGGPNAKQRKLEDKECELLVQRWLLEGASISHDDAEGRKKHLAGKLHDYDAMTEEALAANRLTLFGS